MATEETVEEIDASTSLVEVSAVAALARSEVESQIAAAHKYPRNTKRFLSEAISLATLDEDIAQACIYSVPRDGKVIAGPSVRLAEIALSAYGNAHAAARVVAVEDAFIESQGVTWDIQKNVRIAIQVRRRITKKNGTRFNDDMIQTAGNAASSIALRNSIFRVIPKSYIDKIYNAARATAVGDAKSLGERRERMVRHFGALGVTVERVAARVGKPSVADIGLDELEQLIGLATAIKNGDMSIDAAFPPVDGAPQVSDLDAKVAGEAKQAKPETKAPAGETKGRKAEAKPEPPKPTGPRCLTCNGVIEGGAGLTTTNADGVEGIRHQACGPATNVATWPA